MAFYDYEITILDWPNTFLIQDPHAKIPKEQKEFYPDDPTIYPYMVDLSENYCSCEDFQFAILPFLDDPEQNKDCLHLIITKRYRNQFTERPKKIRPLK